MLIVYTLPQSNGATLYGVRWDGYVICNGYRTARAAYKDGASWARKNKLL